MVINFILETHHFGFSCVLLCSLGIKQSNASRNKARHKIISAVAFVIILVESPCLGNITDAMTQHLSEDECDL